VPSRVANGGPASATWPLDSPLAFAPFSG